MAWLLAILLLISSLIPTRVPWPWPWHHMASPSREVAWGFLPMVGKSPQVVA